MSEMEAPDLIPGYLLIRGLCQKSKLTPRTSSSSSATSSSSSSSSSATSSAPSRGSLAPIPMSPFAFDDYEKRSPSFDYGTLEVNLTPERHSTWSSLQTVDVIDNCVLDVIMEDNRGFCSILRWNKR